MFYAVENTEGSQFGKEETLFCFDTKRLRDSWVSDARYAGYAPWITCTRKAVAAKDAMKHAMVDDYGDRYCCVLFGGVRYFNK